MPRFDPQPGDTLEIEKNIYTVMPHPAVPTHAFGQEGRKAIVYQVANNGRLFAFKIFKQPYRFPRLVDTCQMLSQFKTMTGMEVCNRVCLTSTIAPALLHQYPEMEYGVLMPWVEGTTWFDIIQQKMTLSQELSTQLAWRLADVLANLEEKRLAHCDIAGPNVIVNANVGAVSLIDVEDMYGAGLVLTAGFPAGTDGYQHRYNRASAHGQWCAEGDRFSGAVLLAEMLAWSDPMMREASGEEHFFHIDELHDSKSTNYQRMVDTLSTVSVTVADLFVHAWTSASVADCPSLRSWLESLQKIAPLPSTQLLSPRTIPPTTVDDGRVNTLYSTAWVSLAPNASPSQSLSQTIGKTIAKLERPVISILCKANVKEEVIVRWSSVLGATTYELQLAENDILAQTGIFKTVFRGAQTTYVTRYDTPHHCYYRVCAQAGQLQDSDWSEIVQIEIRQTSQTTSTNIATSAVVVPTWASVEDMSWDTSNYPQTHTVNVEIRWNKTILSTTYELEYAAPDDERNVEHLIQSHKTLDLSLGYHVFRVRATNQQNRKSEWSPKLIIHIEKKQWWHRRPHVDIRQSNV